MVYLITATALTGVFVAIMAQPRTRGTSRRGRAKRKGCLLRF